MSGNCGRCHQCGADLRIVQDGEEWCSVCQTYRRYRSHGWSAAASDPNSETCPDWSRIIVGRRERDGVVVELGDRDLLPSCRHSHDFEWGYGGSGPAETAWVVLETVVGREVAEVCYQHFKWGIVAHLPRTCWQISVNQIREWVCRFLRDAETPIGVEAMAA